MELTFRALARRPKYVHDGRALDFVVQGGRRAMGIDIIDFPGLDRRVRRAAFMTLIMPFATGLRRGEVKGIRVLP